MQSVGSFYPLTREIVLAAREGGGDAEMNFRLRLAVERARAQNMPKENIERAIKRGTGESKDGETFEQIFYEGYGPHGVALMIECMTENRNRTIADLRHILSKSGGNMAEAGSVSWQFRRAAYFSIPADKADFDTVFELGVEGGADDVNLEDDSIEIIAPSENFKILSDRLRLPRSNRKRQNCACFPIRIWNWHVDETMQVLRTIEMLEDLDDVQNVFSNLKISEEAMASLEAE
jgi:YebC/PmpR family DNA-binding regulatory protein